MYTFSTIQNLQTDLIAGNITCVQLVEDSIKTIESKKHLNAFLEVFHISAMEQAKRNVINAKESEKLRKKILGA